MHIEDFLKKNATCFADKVAIYCEDEAITYSQLYAACLKRAKELALKGMQRGDIIPIRAFPSIAYLIDYFSIHMNGGIVVPLEKDIGEEQFQKYCKETRECIVPQETADILFTTGTTGKSKGVMVSHDTIMADAENLICAHGYTSNLTFIICGPLNHCGSWSKVFPCIVQGATIILKDGIKDLNDFFQCIESAATKVATFMVPSSLKIMMQFDTKRLAACAQKIEFIETGGAPMAPGDMLQLCSLLPATRLYNTYASTESGIVSTYNFNDGKCIHGCVGHAMKHSSIQISAEGDILCSGRTLMLGYFNDKALTEQVLKDGVLKMADRGFFDESTMLHICGRNDDIINTGAYKVEPTEVENIALELPYIMDCICIAAPHPILGSALKLLYVPRESNLIKKKEIALYIKSKLEAYKVPVFYEEVDKINLTYNGKKDRKSYRHHDL